MRFNVAWAGVVLAGVMIAAPAQAQVNYYTQGYFTSTFVGCGSPAEVTPVPGSPLGAGCTTAGFTLTWVWYLSVLSVFVQLGISVMLLRREFSRRLVFPAPEPAPATIPAPAA